METFIDGNGEPLVFLHGFKSSKESFSYQLNFFSKFFKVYAPDLPGSKSALLKAFSLSDYAKIISDFFDTVYKRENKKINVIAHSFGARLILKLAPDERIDRLILTGAAGLKPKRDLRYFLKIWGYKSVKAVFGKNIAKKLAKKTASYDYLLLTDVERQSFVKVVNEHLDCKLNKITYPTLIIHGDNDKTTPAYLAKRFNKGIKGSELIFISGGHFAFIDSPQLFNGIAKEFLLND